MTAIAAKKAEMMKTKMTVVVKMPRRKFDCLCGKDMERSWALRRAIHFSLLPLSLPAKAEYGSDHTSLVNDSALRVSLKERVY